MPLLLKRILPCVIYFSFLFIAASRFWLTYIFSLLYLKLLQVPWPLLVSVLKTHFTRVLAVLCFCNVITLLHELITFDFVRVFTLDQRCSEVAVLQSSRGSGVSPRIP